MKSIKKQLAAAEQKQLVSLLKNRFEKNKALHKQVNWTDVEKKLLASPAKLWSLQQMEITGGEPALIGKDKKTGEFIFYDCADESPKGRRSICYDHEALEARKENKPADSAMNMAEEMGVEILTEQQYRELQQMGKYDLKTSSWVQTPAAIRKLKGALFCDRRYDTVFVYHNGAESYYAARGFRASLKV